MIGDVGLPQVGSIIRIVLPGNIERRAKILAHGRHGEDVLVKWVDYVLRDEWIPARWL